MPTSAQQGLPLFQRAAWGGLLTVVTVLSTVKFGCATPFPALAALAALFLPRRDAFILIGVNWLANQIVGFGFLHYPFTADCYRGGFNLLIATLGCAAGAMLTQQLLRHAAGALTALACFTAAFVTYEIVLYAMSPWRNGGDFAPAIVLSILLANVLACAGLLLFQLIAAKVGLVRWRETEGIISSR